MSDNLYDNRRTHLKQIRLNKKRLDNGISDDKLITTINLQSFEDAEKFYRCSHESVKRIYNDNRYMCIPLQVRLAKKYNLKEEVSVEVNGTKYKVDLQGIVNGHTGNFEFKTAHDGHGSVFFNRSVSNGAGRKHNEDDFNKYVDGIIDAYLVAVCDGTPKAKVYMFLQKDMQRANDAGWFNRGTVLMSKFNDFANEYACDHI